MSTTDPTPPFETIPGAATPKVPGLILLCDHASNRVPDDVGDLGLPPQDMARHIAWDVGARGVVLGMAQALGVPAVLSTVSRLVIDANRGPLDPTLVMKLYDGSIIPGNRTVGPDEVARRRSAYHAPYHAAITAAIDAVLAAGQAPVLVSIHSFTPQLRERPHRPWHVGVLWDRDRRLAAPYLAALQAQPDLCVGDNQPYSGSLGGDTMWTHGTNRGIPHALIEVRNDLISDAQGQTAWADRLAQVTIRAISAMQDADNPQE